MFTKEQINKWVNFFQLLEHLIDDYSLRGYDGETILDSKGLCPVCGTQLNEYAYLGPRHELHFNFFEGTYWCRNDDYKNINDGNIVDFIMKIKKIPESEAISWVNNVIQD